MLKSLHSLGSCAENFLLIQISSILSVIFTRLWLKCQRMFWWASCISARHAGSFDCLMTSLILITMDNGRGHCAYWQSCKVPNQTHRGKKTRQIWGIWKLRPAYSPETPNLGQNRWCFVPCDLEIWWMTLENNRASLLCCFKLCATFHSHWWIQTGVTVRKRPFWVKFDDF